MRWWHGGQELETAAQQAWRWSSRLLLSAACMSAWGPGLCVAHACDFATMSERLVGALQIT